MKVGFFLFYPTDFWAPGGGLTSVKNTIEALKRFGVKVELFDICKYERGKRYDILQVIGSSYQLSDFVVTAKKAGERVVVKSVAYSLKAGWQWRFWRLIDPVIPADTVYTYRKRLYENSDLLITESKAEMAQLHKYFGVPSPKMVAIPNGVEERFGNASPRLFIEKFGVKDFILMVGRICENKGQVRVLEALEGEGLATVFIGPPDPAEPDYFKHFLWRVKEQSGIYLDYIPFDSPILASAYAAAKVLAVPSLSETFGNVCLEAGAGGANVVVSKHLPILEYLENRVICCNPKSHKSLREAIIKALNAPRNNMLSEYILRNFNWDIIATKYVTIYEKLLNNKFIFEREQGENSLSCIL